MAEPRQVEEPKDGGSAQSMGLPTSGGDLSSSLGPTHPSTNPSSRWESWQDLTFSSRPKVLQEPAADTSSCARACARACAAACCVCSPCAAGTGSRLFRRHSLGFLRIGRRRPGPSLAISWACGGRQAYPPGLGVLGACTPMPVSLGVVSLTRQASGCAHGMVGPEVAKGDPVRAPLAPGCRGGGGSLELFSGSPASRPLSSASDR